MRSFQVPRDIPKDSTAVEHPLGVVYTYHAGKRLAAIAYAGKANKAAFHHSYFSEEAREKAVKGFVDGLEARKQMVEPARGDAWLRLQMGWKAGTLDYPSG